MSALATNIEIRFKIDEKLHVLGHVDFGRILEGFRERFGRPMSLIFAVFWNFFGSKILMSSWKGKCRLSGGGYPF